ncbi:hypothetical protein M427DRAFT_59488, partial [Gonapodya prolifera JEL478]
GLEDEELPRTLAPSFYQDLPGLTKEQNASLKLAVQRYNAQAFLRLARHIFPQSDLFHSETLLSSLLLDLNPPKADLLPFVSAILASFRGNVRSRIALGLVRGLRAAGALSPRELFWTLDGGATRPRDGRPEPHSCALPRLAHPEPGVPTPRLSCPPALLDCNLPPRHGQPQLPPPQRGVHSRQGARPLRQAARRGGSTGRCARVWTGTAGRHGARRGRPDWEDAGWWGWW